MLRAVRLTAPVVVLGLALARVGFAQALPDAPAQPVSESQPESESESGKGQPAPSEPPQSGPAELRIAEVRVEGYRRVEPEAVKRSLRNREGSAFDPSKTADDLRSLWALNYFQDIQLFTEPHPKGGIVYVVRVSERPPVREVRLSGNKELSKDDFKEAIDIKPYSVLDLDAVRRNVKKIQEKYVEKGYFLAEVTYEIRPVPERAAVDVVFVINEHAKVMVKEIRFLGVEKVPVDELKAVMGTREGGWLSFLTGEGTYREELFQRDLAVVQAAYYDRGFVNVKIDKPLVTLSPDKQLIYITIKVEEGEQYSIGKLDFSGDLLVPKERLFALMTSRVGELFNRSKLSTDILALTDVYYDQGYAYANINPVTAVHPEDRTIDLTFDIQKGQQVTIERIDVVGNTKTRDKVIRRELRVYEGELFNGTGMRRSKERVTALGFFETVEVSHKPGSDQRQVVVQVEIKEKATGSFQLGLGFSNIENFILTAQVSQNNFLGWGISAALNTNLSSLRQLVQLSVYDPYCFDTNFICSVEANFTELDYGEFLRSSQGGNLNVGYHLFEDVMVNLTYSLERARVELITAGLAEAPYANQKRVGLTSSLRLSGTIDKRDNRLFPTKGYMLFASAEVAPPFLGGTFLMAEYQAFARWYYPLPFGLVFKTNVNFGVIQQLDPREPLPLSEMYFLGGIPTIRGYGPRSVTPRVLVPDSGSPEASVDLFPVGGDKQFFVNVELEIPILEKVGIRGVLFYDTGNVFGVGSSFFEDRQYKLPLGLLHSVGVGVRWFSPVGPLRFEWGFPLVKRRGFKNFAGDRDFEFEFNIGNSF